MLCQHLMFISANIYMHVMSTFDVVFPSTGFSFRLSDDLLCSSQKDKFILDADAEVAVVTGVLFVTVTTTMLLLKTCFPIIIILLFMFCTTMTSTRSSILCCSPLLRDVFYVHLPES